MTILVTGSSGHLGEALMRTLGDEARGLAVLPGSYTEFVGSIVDPEVCRRAMDGVRAVIHAATLHKPHVATHSRQAFVDVNVTGTLNLLEAAAAARVEAFVFVSTTSVFGDALTPPPGAPAAWIDEDVVPAPKNIYGATKAAAEDLVQLFHRNQALPCLVLRTSRFFPEADDDAGKRAAYADENLKTNELLHRRVDVEDVVSACRLAVDQAPRRGFRKYIVSATTPFGRDDLADLRSSPAAVLDRRVPGWRAEYARRGWIAPVELDRVYDNARARAELGWRPHYDFATVLQRLSRGDPRESPLAQAIGAKGYHAESFPDGPYPTA